MATPVKTRTGVKVRKPLWGGPCEEGITFSLLTKFLECRERFRLKVVEGLEEDEGFPDAIEYGSMFHLCEEYYRKGGNWQRQLKTYCQHLKQKYPENSTDIEKWQTVCNIQFPCYLEVWKDHPLEIARTEVCTEQVFTVPYSLPSGRVILLRGKTDGLIVDHTGSYRPDGLLESPLPITRAIFGMEHKTKGKVDEEGLLACLFGDLQTQFYQIAMRTCKSDKGFQIDRNTLIKAPNLPVAGVWYNVIRRPLGQFQQHSIRQKVGESEAQFYKRLRDMIMEFKDFFFIRWKTEISEADIALFKSHTFDPIMEQLCDWWEYINESPGPFQPWEPRFYPHKRNPDPEIEQWSSPLLKTPLHYQSPWGVYNSLASGTRGGYYRYLTTGKRDNLVPIKSLYPELEV